MKEFSYSQVLEYYNESYEKFQKQNKNIFFEQDGASCHTSKKIKKLLENLFGDKVIQNAPHSLDITSDRNIVGRIKKKGLKTEIRRTWMN